MYFVAHGGIKTAKWLDMFDKKENVVDCVITNKEIIKFLISDFIACNIRIYIYIWWVNSDWRRFFCLKNKLSANDVGRSAEQWYYAFKSPIYGMLNVIYKYEYIYKIW